MYKEEKGDKIVTKKGSRTPAVLSLEYFKEMLGKRRGKMITQEFVDDFNHLVAEPDYGEEFKNSFVTALSILDGSTAGWSMRQYLDAVKFYSLTAGGFTATSAYCTVFPERLQVRIDRGQGKKDISGEASRFNSTELVNAIRSQSLIPIHLVNQGTVQLAINELTSIMIEGRSEVARVSAATALLKELRPPEAQKVELQVGLTDEARTAQAAQNSQLASIAENQRKLLEAGHDITDIQRLHITKTYVDAEVEDE